VFDRLMPQPNQLNKSPKDEIGAADLLKMHSGERTEAGLRENIRVGVQYIEAWLAGRGAVPLYNLMEDAATAEISRVQIWQWLHFQAELDDGRVVDRELVLACLDDEMAKIRKDGANRPYLDDALTLFRDMSLSSECAEFLTLPAYDWIVAHGV
jgi:malate synthase